MTDYTSIRIKKEIAEKIQLIKIQNNCKSLNETLEQLIPRTVNENYEFIKEQPIFTINNTPITFTDLKNKPVILFNPFFPLLRLFPYICALTNTKPPMK